MRIVLGALALLLMGAAPAPPLPALPAGKCVLDEARVLRVDTLEQLQHICLALDRTGKGQLVVAVVADLHGRSNLADLALEMFRDIRLGHGDRADGVIVVLKAGPRGKNAIRVTVGYGLQGGMTDERIGRLLDEEVGPRIRRHDPDAALIALSERLVSMVMEEEQSGRIERDAEQRRRER